MRRPLSQHHIGVRCAAGELDDHLLRQADDALAGAGDAAGVNAVLPRTVAAGNADTAAVHLNLQMVVAVDGDGFCLRQAGEAEEYAASARVFCKLAEAKIAEAYTYVMNSTTEDVALFKAVENEV